MKTSKLMIVLGGGGGPKEGPAADTEEELTGIDDAIADIESSSNLKISDPKMFCSALQWLIEYGAEDEYSDEESEPAPVEKKGSGLKDLFG